MATKMELSLEDIISQTKPKRGGGRGRGAGGRGRSNVRGRSAGGGRVSRTGGSFGGTRRGGGLGRQGVFRRSGNADGVWAHDKFQDTSLGGARKSGLRMAAPAGAGGAKITISNLHYGVSDADIMELFGELGNIRYASVHYDRTGRSMGKADVVFERRSEAQQAIQEYNGVPLDGRAMMITWASAAAAAPVARSPAVSRVQGGRVNRTGGGGGARGKFRGGRGAGRGGGRGRGGRNNPKPPTAAELDAELDEYVSQNQK